MLLMTLMMGEQLIAALLLLVQLIDVIQYTMNHLLTQELLLLMNPTVHCNGRLMSIDEYCSID